MRAFGHPSIHSSAACSSTAATPMAIQKRRGGAARLAVARGSDTVESVSVIAKSGEVTSPRRSRRSGLRSFDGAFVTTRHRGRRRPVVSGQSTRRPCKVRPVLQLIVLGMHRSGTSALTPLLAARGCQAGPPESLQAGDAANPQGYWESRAAWALDEEALAALGASWWEVADLDLAALDAAQRESFTARARAIVGELGTLGARPAAGPP